MGAAPPWRRAAPVLLLLLSICHLAAAWGSSSSSSNGGASAQSADERIGDAKTPLDAHIASLLQPDSAAAFEAYGALHRTWAFNLSQAHVADGIAYSGFNFGLRRFLSRLMRGERVKVRA